MDGDIQGDGWFSLLKWERGTSFGLASETESLLACLKPTWARRTRAGEDMVVRGGLDVGMGQTDESRGYLLAEPSRLYGERGQKNQQTSYLLLHALLI